MSLPSNKFTFKIIISYAVLGALMVFVSVFLYNEIKEEFKPNQEDVATAKIVETGSLINSLYETNSFANLALISLQESDFENYVAKNDSLFMAIDSLKTRTDKPFQKKQLDSIKMLLDEKVSNIEQLRKLKLAISQDNSLDAILKEFKTLETNMGVVTLENFVENPKSLSKENLQKVQNYIDYINASRESDNPTVRASVVDSMLAATRFIVSGAKRSSVRLRRTLLEKENELIRYNLSISEQLKRIIYDFEAEINRNQRLENLQKEASVARTSRVLRIAAIAGAVVILLFSYWLITDFFRAEKLKNKLQKEKQTTDALLRSREQLISTVSHDLKTPLSTIAGYTELFKNTTLTEKQLHYTNHISASTAYISKLADDLLDLSKLEVGKIRIEHVPFSLNNLITQIAENNASLHVDKPVQLKLEIDPQIKDRFYESDPIRIRQIVNNLISNAFKFTQEGSVTVGVNSKKLKASKSLITISVTDTGIGISEEKQGLIFEEFTQAEDDTAQKFGGSGLGLTISKKLAKLLDGELNLTSRLGEGSSFIFSLPLKKAKHQVKPIEKEKSSFKKLKAIIIDDDTALLTMLEELFNQMSIEVKTFQSFSEVIKAKPNNFDFILTDKQMPDFSGEDILKTLHGKNHSWYNMQPVILMTGDRNFETSYYLALGFAAMILKPFKIDEIKSVLGELFPSSSASEVKKAKITTSSNESTNTYDLTMLASFLENEDAIREVLAAFIKQSHENMTQLNSAVQSKDYEQMGNTAHMMLTMCRQIQAKKVVTTLEKLEHYKQNNLSTDEIKKLVASLQINMSKLLTEIEAY